jgi:hypothetical protein
MYVVHACTVGSLPAVPAVAMNYGAASILTPSDFAFSRDGILAEGNINQEMMVIGDVNLRTILVTRDVHHPDRREAGNQERREVEVDGDATPLLLGEPIHGVPRQRAHQG